MCSTLSVSTRVLCTVSRHLCAVNSQSAPVCCEQLVSNRVLCTVSQHPCVVHSQHLCAMHRQHLCAVKLVSTRVLCVCTSVGTHVLYKSVSTRARAQSVSICVLNTVMLPFILLGNSLRLQFPKWIQ